uniref:SET and MYND domain-containing protein 5 n=1 Tax=Schistocephalus solidus TaxID=70667 RepID=A0A0V0J9I1_SCHSO
MNHVRAVDLGPPKGRTLVSTRIIRPEDIIFSERPLVCCQFSWNRFYGYLACDYCLRPLETAEANARRLLSKPDFCLPRFEDAPFSSPLETIVACQNCTVQYCCDACRSSSAAEYHSFLCPALCPDPANNAFTRLDEEWRNSQHPPETGTVMLLVRMAAAHFSAHFKKDPQAMRIVQALGRFVSSLAVEAASSTVPNSSTTLVHKLLCPNFSGSLSCLHACFLEALKEMARRVGYEGPSFTEALQEAGLQAMLSEAGFCSAMCLIGRNGQGIGTTPLGLWGTVCEARAIAQGGEAAEKFESFLDSLYEQLDQTVGDFLDNEGVGLYEHQSLLNHSCEPNTYVRFESGTSELQIVAKEEIPPDIELTISYLDGWMLSRGRHSRQKWLSEHYLFLCECPRCVSEKQEYPESATSSEESNGEEDDADDEEEPMSS